MLLADMRHGKGTHFETGLHLGDMKTVIVVVK